MTLSCMPTRSEFDMESKCFTLHAFSEKFLGLEEKPGMNHEPAILAALQLDADWVDSDETAWCSAAVNALCWMLELPRSGRLNARSWLNVGKEVHVPKVGNDIVIFWRENPDSWKGHVGIFGGFDGDKVICRGGNQSNKFSDALYPRSRVLGYRRLLG